MPNGGHKVTFSFLDIVALATFIVVLAYVIHVW